MRKWFKEHGRPRLQERRGGKRTRGFVVLRRRKNPEDRANDAALTVIGYATGYVIELV